MRCKRCLSSSLVILKDQLICTTCGEKQDFLSKDTQQINQRIDSLERTVKYFITKRKNNRKKYNKIKKAITTLEKWLNKTKELYNLKEEVYITLTISEVQAIKILINYIKETGEKDA